jgi:hypothetical protein
LIGSEAESSSSGVAKSSTEDSDCGLAWSVFFDGRPRFLGRCSATVRVRFKGDRNKRALVFEYSSSEESELCSFLFDIFTETSG